MTRIFVADTETTGLKSSDRVVEYAHLECRLQANRLVVVKQFETLTNPGIPIPEGAMKVHGVNDAMIAKAPYLRDVLPAALGVAKNEYAKMFGHNFTAYDMQFLDGLIPDSFDIGCTLKAARMFIDAPRHSLDFLREHLDLPEALAHSALGDCCSTFHLINHMLAAGTPWDALSSCMLSKPTAITFGKHKGTLLQDLPDDYVRWLLEKCDNTSWELRRALKELA